MPTFDESLATEAANVLLTKCLDLLAATASRGHSGTPEPGSSGEADANDEDKAKDQQLQAQCLEDFTLAIADLKAPVRSERAALVSIRVSTMYVSSPPQTWVVDDSGGGGGGGGRL